MHTSISALDVLLHPSPQERTLDLVDSFPSLPPLECIGGAVMRSSTPPPPSLICPPINKKTVDVGSYHTTHPSPHCPSSDTRGTNHLGPRRKPGPEVARRAFPAAKRVRMRSRPWVCESRVLEEIEIFCADVNDLQSLSEIEAVVLDLQGERGHLGV